MGLLDKMKVGLKGEEITISLAGKVPKSTLTTAIKRNLIEERGRKCEYCKEDYKEWVFDIHHIIPREYKECTDEKDNLLVLCANCHKEFNHKWDELRRQVKKSDERALEITTKQLRNLPKWVIN